MCADRLTLTNQNELEDLCLEKCYTLNTMFEKITAKYLGGKDRRRIPQLSFFSLLTYEEIENTILHSHHWPHVY